MKQLLSLHQLCLKRDLRISHAVLPILSAKVCWCVLCVRRLRISVK